MSSSKDRIDLSLLIATRNRARLLETTLGHLERQQMGAISWELIIIDNGSTDATQAVLKRASNKLPLKVLYEPEPGRNRALNRALEVTRGELLVYSDDDIEPTRKWLAELYRAMKRWPSDNIFCGPIYPKFPANFPDWLASTPYIGALFAVFMPAQPEGPLTPGILPYGPNYAVRSRLMESFKFCTSVGPRGNSFAMGGETELLLRLVAKGERVIFAPCASVTHFVDEHQMDLDWLYKRAFRLGRGKARIKPDRRFKCISGIPWPLFYQIPATSLSYLTSRFSDMRVRFNKGMDLYYQAGQFYEYALLNRGPGARVSRKNRGNYDESQQSSVSNQPG
jgi:glycosyltransferase involved in cell wall biosynthesis